MTAEEMAVALKIGSTIIIGIVVGWMLLAGVWLLSHRRNTDTDSSLSVRKNGRRKVGGRS